MEKIIFLVVTLLASSFSSADTIRCRGTDPTGHSFQWDFSWSVYGKNVHLKNSLYRDRKLIMKDLSYFDIIQDDDTVYFHEHELNPHAKNPNLTFDKKSSKFLDFANDPILGVFLCTFSK